MRQPGDPEGPGCPLQLSQGLPGPGCSQGKLDGRVEGPVGTPPDRLWAGGEPGQAGSGWGRGRYVRGQAFQGGSWEGWGWMPGLPGGPHHTGCLIRPRPFRVCVRLGVGWGPPGQGFWRMGRGASRHAQQCPPSGPAPPKMGLAPRELGEGVQSRFCPLKYKVLALGRAPLAPTGRAAGRKPAGLTWGARPPTILRGPCKGSQSLPAARGPPHSRCTLGSWAGGAHTHHPTRPPRGRGGPFWAIPEGLEPVVWGGPGASPPGRVPSPCPQGPRLPTPQAAGAPSGLSLRRRPWVCTPRDCTGHRDLAPTVPTPGTLRATRPALPTRLRMQGCPLDARGEFLPRVPPRPLLSLPRACPRVAPVFCPRPPLQALGAGGVGSLGRTVWEGGPSPRGLAGSCFQPSVWPGSRERS